MVGYVGPRNFAMWSKARRLNPEKPTVCDLPDGTYAAVGPAFPTPNGKTDCFLYGPSGRWTMKSDVEREFENK